MVIKLFTSALLVFFLAACSTTPKDTADSSGSGSSCQPPACWMLVEDAAGY